VRTNKVIQRVGTQVDDVDGRRVERTNVGQQWVSTRFCDTRTQVSDVVGIRAVRTNVASGNGGRRAAGANVGQQWVETRFCNTYERRLPM